MDKLVGRVLTGPVEWLYGWLWRRGLVEVNGVNVRCVKAWRPNARVVGRLGEAEQGADWFDRLGVLWRYCAMRDEWRYRDGGAWRKCVPSPTYGPYVEVLDGVK